VAKAPGFLNSPTGNGLPVMDPKTFTSAADQQQWNNKAHIEYAHIS
jgi:hypothetical protein